MTTTNKKTMMEMNMDMDMCEFDGQHELRDAPLAGVILGGAFVAFPVGAPAALVAEPGDDFVSFDALLLGDQVSVAVEADDLFNRITDDATVVEGSVTALNVWWQTVGCRYLA